jgi:hypothetical protein
MELTVPKKDLLKLIARMQGVAERKSTMPVLSNVLLAGWTTLAVLVAIGCGGRSISPPSPPIDGSTPSDGGSEANTSTPTDGSGEADASSAAGESGAVDAPNTADASSPVDAPTATDAPSAVDASTTADASSDTGRDVSPPCTPGAPCTPAGDVCRTGTTTCAMGVATCAASGDVANGTSCGAGETCVGGVCMAASCTPGATCNPGNPPNPCLVGTVSCNGSQAICDFTGNAADGTACGADQICCGGACASCPTLTNASAACAASSCVVTCNGGLTLCATRCQDTTNDNSACGPSCAACPSGTTCTASKCVGEYGNFTPFACVSSTNEIINTGFIAGQSIDVVTAVTVTDLGVIGSPSMPAGVHGILALYTSVGGDPSTLVAQTASTAIAAANNAIPVTSPVAIPAGSYFVMAEYDAIADVCTDSATSNKFYYASIASYGTVPATIAASSVGALAPYPNLNYYLVATQ